jgi:hypothetical protein
VFPDGKNLRKSIAKSIVLDGILSASIRSAFESADHPEEQSIIYYSGVAGAIIDIYTDSVELKEIVPCEFSSTINGALDFEMLNSF